jgi:predicted GNAT superfamily acetyltransferase
VKVSTYVPDMYGESASPLHRGIGTDRFIVSWPVDDVALAARRREIATDHEAAGSDVVRVEVPSDVGVLQISDMPAARGWRTKTRAAFQSALANGYVVQGFQRANGSASGYYVLERSR